MPRTYDINVDHLLKNIPPETLDLFKKTNFGFEAYWLYYFLLSDAGKKAFLKEKKETEYYALVKALWKSYPPQKINTSKDGQTLLMGTIEVSKDPTILQFAIEQTSDKGINAKCPDEGKVDGEHYALAAACSLELHCCIEPLLARSNTDSLKAAKEYFEIARNSKTYRSIAFNGSGNIGKSYTLADIDRYIKMIDDRLLKLKFSWVPVLGPFVHDMMYPETTNTSAKAVPATSLGKPVHPTVASTSFSQPASAVQPVV